MLKLRTAGGGGGDINGICRNFMKYKFRSQYGIQPFILWTMLGTTLWYNITTPQNTLTEENHGANTNMDMQLCEHPI